MAEVFLSYARADRPLAEHLVARLERSKYQVWWDFHLLPISDSFNSVIDAQLQSSAACIVIWTRLSVKSAFVNAEALRANEFGKLINISDGSIAATELPLPFNAQHVVAIDDEAAILGAVAHLVGVARQRNEALPGAPSKSEKALETAVTAIARAAHELLALAEKDSWDDSRAHADRLVVATRALLDAQSQFVARLSPAAGSTFETALSFKRVSDAIAGQTPILENECDWLKRSSRLAVIQNARAPLGFGAETLLVACKYSPGQSFSQTSGLAAATGVSVHASGAASAALTRRA